MSNNPQDLTVESPGSSSMLGAPSFTSFVYSRNHKVGTSSSSYPQGTEYSIRNPSITPCSSFLGFTVRESECQITSPRAASELLQILQAGIPEAEAYCDGYVMGIPTEGTLLA